MCADRLLVYDVELKRRKNETNIELTNEIYSASYKKQFNLYEYQIKQFLKKENGKSQAKDFRIIHLNQTFDDFYLLSSKTDARFVVLN